MSTAVTGAQRPCTDDEIWAVFPSSQDLGNVNDQLLTKSGPTVSKDGSRIFSMRWQGASSSRSVSVTLTEYPTPRQASQKIHAYGFDDQKGQVKTGMVKLAFGDEGYKTDDRKRPYYLVHKGQFALSYYTSYPGRSGGSPGNQDPTVKKIIQQTATLPCLGLTIKPPPPPGNNCPKVSVSASPPTATPSQTIKMTATATDPEGDALTMTWSLTDLSGKQTKAPWNGRVFTGNGQLADTVSWKNPPAGQYRINVKVIDGKCGNTEKASAQVHVQSGMEVSVATERKTYSPGETALIKGRVGDQNGGLDGATVVINVEGTLLTKKTDPSGNYRCPFPIPSSGQSTQYKVVVTASHVGYADKTQSTHFNVGKRALIVKIITDKTHYLKGESVNCRVTVMDSDGFPVPNADLTVFGSRLKSGRRTVMLNDHTQKDGQKAFSFTWGETAIASGVPDGKLQIEVKAEHLGRSTWEGYDPGYGSVIVSGCGDGHLECPSPNAYCENCFNCPKDSKCQPEEVCDPSNELSDPKTGCSPKMAIIFTTFEDPLYTWRHQLFASDELTFIQKKFKEKKYHLKEVKLKGKMVYFPKEKKEHWVPDRKQIAKYLARPSTKAMAFFGHGGSRQDENRKIYKPSLGGNNTAIQLQISVLHQTALNYQKLYKIDYMKAYNKAQTDIMATANWNCGLDEAYIHACHSLDDNSLRDFLLRSGGIYWGDKGILYGIFNLVEMSRP